MAHLLGKCVAILVIEGFEQVEMTRPCEALDQAGAKTPRAHRGVRATSGAASRRGRQDLAGAQDDLLEDSLHRWRRRGDESLSAAVECPSRPTGASSLASKISPPSSAPQSSGTSNSSSVMVRRTRRLAVPQDAPDVKRWKASGQR